MSIIVVPIVKTHAGTAALELAKTEARARDCALVLVGNAKVSDDLVENVEALREYLTQLEKDLIEEGFDCRTEWSVGDTLASTTVDAARKLDALLIVVGLRQRSAVGKALLGSYEQEILLSAPCPVLSVRATGPER